MNEAFVRAVKLLIKKEIKANITIGRIKSVDGSVCDVERDGLPDLLEVRLNAAKKEFESSFNVYPKVGSEVLCAIIENNEAEAYVIGTTEIDSVEIWFDSDKKKGLKLTSDGAVFDEGINGGMTITPELKTQLDKMTARIDGIMDAINNGVVATGPPDSGATLLASFKTGLLLITDNEDFSNIENERVKH